MVWNVDSLGRSLLQPIESVLLRRWRPAARPAVPYEAHNPDDDQRSAPHNPSVLKEVHERLLFRKVSMEFHSLFLLFGSLRGAVYLNARTAPRTSCKAVRKPTRRTNRKRISRPAPGRRSARLAT